MVYFNSGLFPYTAIKSPGEETLITAGGQSLGLKAAELIGSAGALTHEFTNGNGGFAAFLTTDELKRIMAHPEVASVNATSRARRSSLWGHDRINQRVAPLDSNSTVAGVSNGAGVHIYIIDSGIRGTHTAFTGRLSAGYSPPLVSANPYIDVDGHGTHVTGIAGGTTYGVATGATLHAVSIVDSSGNWAFEPEVINALNWVKNNHVAPAVVNCSWSIGYSTNVEAAVYDLLNSGAKVVFAAGNFAAATTDFPAAIGEVIAVGASEINISGNDEKAVFTNYGNKVDVYAPGTQILSADIANDTASRDDSGTSMATPFVTGTIALYLQTHMTDTQDEVRNAIVVNATREIIPIPGGEWGHLLYLSQNWMLHNKIIGDAQLGTTSSGALIATDVLHPNGTYYDQVLMTGQDLTVQADPGQTTRVSWIDDNYDIVMAELTGSGSSLRITLDNYVGPASYPAYYNQPGVNYVKGKATISIEGSTQNTYVSVFSLGTANTLTPGLFVQPSSAYHGIADVKLVRFWKSQFHTLLPQVGFGGLYTGNVNYSGSTGDVGVSLTFAAVTVMNRLVVRDIDASGSARAVLQLGSTHPLNSDVGRVRIAGGDLFQTNGTRIVGVTATVPSPTMILYTTSNLDSHGRFTAPQALSSYKFAYLSGAPWQIAYDCIDHGGFPVSSGVTSP